MREGGLMMAGNVTQFTGAFGSPEDPAAEVAAFLRPFAQDPAQRARFRALYPDLVPLMRTLVEQPPEIKLQGPCPNGLQVLQVTIYDNWRGPTPPKANWPYSRYGLDIRGWLTAPTSKSSWNNPSWAGECRNVWPSKDALAKARRLLKRNLVCPITTVEVEDIEALRGVVGNIGIVHQRVRKSHTEYFHRHYATLTFEAGAPVVNLLFPDASYVLSDFVATNPDQSSLNGRKGMESAIGQVRFSTDPAMQIGANRAWVAGACVVE